MFKDGDRVVLIRIDNPFSSGPGTIQGISVNGNYYISLDCGYMAISDGSDLISEDEALDKIHTIRWHWDRLNKENIEEG